MWRTRALAGLSLILAFHASATCAADSASSWSPSEIIPVGVEPPHARLLPFPDVDRARAGDESRSPWIRSLNGSWRFQWNSSPERRDVTFHRTGADVSAWAEIVVPSNWEAAGFGRTAPDEAKGVGSYRREFRIDESWRDREVFLRFDSVGPRALVWVNGTRIGSTASSKTTTEFRITDAVHAGQNVLAVQVFGLPAGRAGWLSGIDGDVIAYATPSLYIEDIDLRATFDPDSLIGRARMAVVVRNLGDTPVGDSPLAASIWRAGVERPFETERVTCDADGRARRVLELDIPNADAWSAEMPNLYTLTVSVGSDDSTHVVGMPVGFCRIEIRNGQLHVNGAPLVLRGVRHRAVHSELGYAVPAGAMRREIALMKEANINAVWADGFSVNEAWLSLCDRDGLYVINEPNRGEWWGEGEDDSLRTIVLADRRDRMVAGDRRHPSLIGWSLGDTATPEGVRGFRTRGDQRLLIHPHRDGEGDERSDVLALEYPTSTDIEQRAEDEPKRAIVMSPSAHVAGNSLGGFAELTRVADGYANVIGGFVSMWADDPWREGGLARGVIAADGEKRPLWYELKRAYEPVSIRALDLEAAKFVILNRRHLRSLDDLVLAWDIQADGQIVLRGGLDLPHVEPGSAYTFELVTDSIQPEPGREYVVSLRVSRSGQVLVIQQFVLPIFRSPAPVESEFGDLVVTAVADTVRIVGESFSVAIERSRGEWVSYRYRDRELLARGPRAIFWRSPTDNDIAAGRDESTEGWRRASEQPQFVDFEVLEASKRLVRTRTRYELPEVGGRYEVEVVVRGNGDVDLDLRLTTVDGEVATPSRVGVKMMLPPDFDRVRWFGLGPHESYGDRAASGVLGLHEMRATDPRPDYGREQERGNRSDVRWMTITDPDGVGWLLVGETMFSMNVFAVESAGSEWRIDAAMRGVGGNVPRGGRPAPESELDAGTYHLLVRFRPHDDSVHDMRRRARATRER